VRRAAALLALGLATLSSPVAAQQAARSVRPRPPLEAGADTNDWEAYYRRGLGLVRLRPDQAAASFYWASRLAPERAEPLYALWVESWLERRSLFLDYMNGHGADGPEARMVDSIVTLALMRDPFVHQGLVRVLQAAKADAEFGVDHWRFPATPEYDAWLDYTEGTFDRASAAFAKAIRKEPKRIDLHVFRARSLAGQLLVDSAAAELTWVLDAMRAEDRKRLVYVYDSKAMFEYSLGTLHARRRDFAAARAAFVRALEDDISFYAAHAELAKLALFEGDTAGAVREFEAAVAVDASDPVIAYDFGVVLLTAKRVPEAVEQLGRAVALAPDYAAARFNLAIALEKAGRADDAIEQYAAFVVRAPRALAPQAESALDRIAALSARETAK
jgi:tetratricopeptide (TPR) repeat protein